MPVVVLPNTPSHPPGFGTSHSSKATAFASQRVNQLTPTTLAIQNGATRFHDDMSVVEIKAKAREAVQKEAKGASALSLIRTARTQLLSAKDYETKGDLRSALGSFIKAASLAKMTMDSAEYSQEGRSKGGVLKKELGDFLSVCLDLITFHPFSDGFVFTRAMGAI
jgi:ubiquitin carboxyl-terminal hydrolase 8